MIPKLMRSEMLDIILESHLGVQKCQERARDVIFWPGKDIENLVSKCER